MACCGRASNRDAKSSKQKYLERYAYLTKKQRAERDALSGTKCIPCGALTFGDPCSICQAPKAQEQK